MQERSIREQRVTEVTTHEQRWHQIFIPPVKPETSTRRASILSDPPAPLTSRRRLRSKQEQAKPQQVDAPGEGNA